MVFNDADDSIEGKDEQRLMKIDLASQSIVTQLTYSYSDFGNEYQLFLMQGNELFLPLVFNTGLRI